MGHSFLFLYMCLYFWFENWTFESNEFVTRKQISPFYRVCSLLLFLFIFLFFWLLQSISVLKISLMCKLSLLRSFWACTLSWACSALSNFLPKREKKLNDGRAKGLRSFKSPGSYFSRRERDLKQWREMELWLSVSVLWDKNTWLEHRSLTFGWLCPLYPPCHHKLDSCSSNGAQLPPIGVIIWGWVAASVLRTEFWPKLMAICFLNLPLEIADF